MAFDKAAAAKILAHIDRNELAQVGCDLASIPSPTGQEKAIAEYILAWFEARGRRISARNEEIDIEELVKAAQIYALMALDICSRERPRQRISI
jgi:acetylornithine deacetylase/succinyl-diaminopimelate desuccinylase-like protein